MTIILSLVTFFSLALSAITINQPAQPAPDLSADEIAGLTYMREEEKLAHDVYVFLYDQWGIPVFNNIAAAETAHTTAVQRLLASYGIPDPAVGNAPGVFSDPDLQALYNQLVAEGSTSLTAAYYVGATIEEVDIADLQQRIATSRHADITAIYENLLRGSSNHLRAYVNQWQSATGETYVPQILSQADFAAFMGGSAGNSNGNGRGYGRWGNNRLPTGSQFGRITP